MRPRLTRKVIRGLRDLLAHATEKIGPLDPAGQGSARNVAQEWIINMNDWASRPRRTGPIPPQFRTKRRRRR